MKKIFLILTLFSGMSLCIDDPHEIKIYRSVPSYGLLFYGVCFALPLPLFILPSPKQSSFLTKVALGTFFFSGTSFIIARQIHAYRMRNKPAVIINDEGIGCYDMWFRKDLFCKWRDVTRVLLREGGFGLNSIIIYSTTHYPISLHLIELDFSAKKLSKIIKSHISF